MEMKLLLKEINKKVEEDKHCLILIDPNYLKMLKEEAEDRTTIKEIETPTYLSGIRLLKCNYLRDNYTILEFEEEIEKDLAEDYFDMQRNIKIGSPDIDKLDI